MAGLNPELPERHGRAGPTPDRGVVSQHSFDSALCRQSTFHRISVCKGNQAGQCRCWPGAFGLIPGFVARRMEVCFEPELPDFCVAAKVRFREMGSLFR